MELSCWFCSRQLSAVVQKLDQQRHLLNKTSSLLKYVIFLFSEYQVKLHKCREYVCSVFQAQNDDQYSINFYVIAVASQSRQQWNKGTVAETKRLFIALANWVEHKRRSLWSGLVRPANLFRKGCTVRQSWLMVRVFELPACVRVCVHAVCVARGCMYMWACVDDGRIIFDVPFCYTCTGTIHHLWRGQCSQNQMHTLQDGFYYGLRGRCGISISSALPVQSHWLQRDFIEMFAWSWIVRTIIISQVSNWWRRNLRLQKWM